MPTTIDSAGITFNDTTSLTSANGVPSALKLTTARTINGVSFDGTANITVPATASGANVAKAWVNFNGTTSPGTIRSSYNVSSVTKNGTGDYTVNFTTPMTDANYSYLLSGESNAVYTMIELQGNIANPPTINSLRLNCRMGGGILFDDSARLCVAIFGN
jgi:hypothetical protein